MVEEEEEEEEVCLKEVNDPVSRSMEEQVDSFGCPVDIVIRFRTLYILYSICYVLDVEMSKSCFHFLFFLFSYFHFCTFLIFFSTLRTEHALIDIYD